MKRHPALALVLLTLAVSAQAERPRIWAITGARIVTAPGKVIENGTIVLREDSIAAVGAKVAVPEDAEVIAAQEGWTVYPAFIDAASAVALPAEPEPRPGAGGGPAPKPAPPIGAKHELRSVHPETAVVDQIDPAQESVAKHRAMGFAVANVVPARGVFRGESAIIALRAGAARELVVKDRFAQVVALETQSFMARQYPSSKMGAVATVRQALLDAGRDEEWQKRYAANPTALAAPEYRSSDEPLGQVLAGQRPVIFVSIAALDPGRFAGLATEFDLKAMTMARGLGDRVDDLGAAGMPLLLPLELPEKPDTKDADVVLDTTLKDMQSQVGATRLPGKLDAGRKLAFVTAGMKDPKKFTENLAAVVKAGLDPARALAAVTTSPAELLGVSRVMGTLEPGKQANLLVVEGDLFAEKPKLRHLFVQGYHERIDPDRKPEGGKPPGAPQSVDEDTVDLEVAE